MTEQAYGTARRLHLAGCVLDLEARELRTSDDRPVQLRAKALDVLLILAERAGQVVDKRTLMERVWASIYDGISRANFERARLFFEQAVAIDPSHRRGLGGTAITHHWLLLTGWASDRQLSRRRVLDTAERLEELYPNDTLTALASSSAADVAQRWDLLLLIGDRLCESDPDSPTSHCERGLALLKLGRFDECLSEIGDAMRLSVDDFRIGWWHSVVATAHLMMGHHGEAALAARQATARTKCRSFFTDSHAPSALARATTAAPT
jgi:tetratricopeptide (TPR) repeat protein